MAGATQSQNTTVQAIWTEMAALNDSRFEEAFHRMQSVAQTFIKQK